MHIGAAPFSFLPRLLYGSASSESWPPGLLLSELPVPTQPSPTFSFSTFKTAQTSSPSSLQLLPIRVQAIPGFGHKNTWQETQKNLELGIRGIHGWSQTRISDFRETQDSWISISISTHLMLPCRGPHRRAAFWFSLSFSGRVHSWFYSPYWLTDELEGHSSVPRSLAVLL